MDDLKSYRYPGVRPFSTNDSDVFFGREDDTTRLFKLLMLEKLVVLFGKSGHGKSSIINAGIIPIFKDKSRSERFQYLPIEVRIGKVSGQNASPIDKVVAKLNEQCPDLEEWKFLEKYQQEPTLWHHFKRKQSKLNRKFILIFDQFEEFFTYSNAEQEIFCWQLAELLYTEIPQNIREGIDDLTDEKFALLSARFDIKVLFSIRSDRLSLLHSMKEALPGILHSRFEIKGLSPEQAKEAIRLPALNKSTKFVTHPFSYDDNSLGIILKELLTEVADGSQIIEAFHLQIICQACESKIEEKLEAGIVDTEINEEDLPEFNNLYEEYYKRQIDKLPAELRSQAQTVLEEGLIFEDTQSGEARRLSVDGNILRKQFDHLGMQDDLLSLLENTFLVRREPNTVGGFSYEVSHDTILEPIIKSKNEREKQKQVIIRTEEIKKAALKEYARKRRIQGAAVIAGLLVVVMLYLNWRTIYYGYITYTKHEEKPVIRLQEKLDSIVTDLSNQMLEDSKGIGYDPKIGNWTASQIMIGLQGIVADSIKQNFFKLTLKSIVDTGCCCWVEVVNQKDFRASGWITSTIGSLKLTRNYPCNVLNFFIDNQLNDGSWSMLPINKSLTQYGSTYATCHVLRALYTSMDNMRDSAERNKIRQVIDKGADWLIRNKRGTKKSLWNDYPKDIEFEGLLSNSLSGLAIHTLNLIGHASPDLNKQWLKNLNIAEGSVEINHKEQSDKLYSITSAGADFRDLTRHLVIPWEIIATVDAFKDGNLSEKTHASIWVDHIVSNLDAENINKNPGYIKAEILISLRYLQNRGYVFQ